MLTSTEVSKSRTFYRPSRSRADLSRLHEVIPKLCMQLFRQRFQRELEWCKGSDTPALSRVLALNPTWTVEDVEMMVRAYYASDGIRYAGQPYEWLPQLGNYQNGPLNGQGTPKATLAAIEAEVAQRNARIDAEIQQRNADRKARDKKAFLDRAIAASYRDLRSKGYEVFRAMGSMSCHLLASSELTRWAHALRIIVRIDESSVVADGRYYQALVTASSRNSDSSETLVVRYEPPLPGQRGAEETGLLRQGHDASSEEETDGQ